MGLIIMGLSDYYTRALHRHWPAWVAESKKSKLYIRNSIKSTDGCVINHIDGALTAAVSSGKRILLMMRAWLQRPPETLSQMAMIMMLLRL